MTYTPDPDQISNLAAGLYDDLEHEDITDDQRSALLDLQYEALDAIERRLSELDDDD